MTSTYTIHVRVAFSLISWSCSAPPNSTRPALRLFTLMLPLGAMTSPSSVTTLGCSACFLASR